MESQILHLLSSILPAGLFILSIVVPFVFWFIFLRWQDRLEPEPWTVVVRAFFLGVGAAFLAMLVEEVVFSLFSDRSLLAPLAAERILDLTWGSALVFICVGVIEELLKFTVLWARIFPKQEFNQIADGIFYAMVVALGFSITENVFYFYALFGQPHSVFVSDTIVRAIATTILHLTATGLVGYALGKRKFLPGFSGAVVVFSIMGASMLHIVFNLLLLFEKGVIIAFPLTFLVFVGLLQRMHRKEAQLVWYVSGPRVSRSSAGKL